MFLKRGQVVDDEYLSQRLLPPDDHILPPRGNTLNIMVNRTQLAPKEFQASSGMAKTASKYHALTATTSPQPHAEPTPALMRLTTFPGCPRKAFSRYDQIAVTREPESTSTLSSEAAEARGNPKRPVTCCIRVKRRVRRRTNKTPKQRPKARPLLWKSSTRRHRYRFQVHTPRVRGSRRALIQVCFKMFNLVLIAFRLFGLW